MRAQIFAAGDYDEDFKRAQESLKAIEKLSETLKKTEFSFDTAETVLNALSFITPLAPFLAVGGFILAFLEIFFYT